MSTLAVGKTQHQMFEGLGAFHNIAMPCNPMQALMILAGYSGTGTSALVRSCKEAFIFNVDGSSADTPARGWIWPGVRKDGTPITVDPRFPNDPDKGTPLGRPLVWQDIIDKTKILIQMAQQNVAGRPQMVVLDTLDVAYNLMQQHVLMEYNKTAEPGKEKASFGDIHGKLAYPWLYETCTEWVLSLRQAGYGVCLTAHLGDRTIYLDGDRKEYKKDTWKLPENFVNVLERLCEVIGCVEREVTSSAVLKPVIDPKTGKQAMNGTQPKTTMVREEKTEVYLTFESEKMQGLTKKRSEYPDRIKLPRVGGWDLFMAEHNKFLQRLDNVQENAPAA
jgi:hypothetical protein